MTQVEKDDRAPSLYLPISSIFPRGNLTGNFPKSAEQSKPCVNVRFQAAGRGLPAPGATALSPQPTIARGGQDAPETRKGVQGQAPVTGGHGAAAGRPDVAAGAAGQGRGLPLP